MFIWLKFFHVVIPSTLYKSYNVLFTHFTVVHESTYCNSQFWQKMKWHSNSGHLEKHDIKIKQFEVSHDKRKKELFKAV